jgi:Transposase
LTLTSGGSDGGTEAMNLLIEKTRRLAHGFRNFTHDRLRILLAANGTLTYRRLHCFEFFTDPVVGLLSLGEATHWP